MTKKMSLDVADEIRLDWGKFLEITNGNLMMLFRAKIPESLLPYPKNAIREALLIVSEQFSKQGDEEGSEIAKSTLQYLEWYVEDRIALESASEQFGDEIFLEVTLSGLGDKQNEQLEYILNKRS